VGALLFLLSNLSPNIYLLMVNFTTGGFFLAFLFPLVGALVVQLRGTWRPGPFTLGRGSLLVTVLAVVWAAFEFLNISWPRAVNADRYLDWSVWIAVAVLGVLGAAIFTSVRSRIVTAALIDEEELADERADELAHPV
ncbi:MAG TPA: amino acid permease, partial [Candidatus Angelobacter sp.]|nr:amino acid permease [Candidatus Angelobacter sp.]